MMAIRDQEGTMADHNAEGKQTLEIGGLRFVVMHRAIGEDGGATIEVYGDVEGKPEQVLRFDCFRKMPHFHYAPMRNREQHELDRAKVDDPLDWSLGQIRGHLPEMLETAGFTDLAGKVDQEALSAGWTKVKDAVAATAPVG